MELCPVDRVQSVVVFAVSLLLRPQHYQIAGFISDVLNRSRNRSQWFFLSTKSNFKVLGLEVEQETFNCKLCLPTLHSPILGVLALVAKGF